jgi:hypothetical protein
MTEGQTYVQRFDVTCMQKEMCMWACDTCREMHHQNKQHKKPVA